MGLLENHAKSWQSPVRSIFSTVFIFSKHDSNVHTLLEPRTAFFVSLKMWIYTIRYKKTHIRCNKRTCHFFWAKGGWKNPTPKEKKQNTKERANKKKRERNEREIKKTLAVDTRVVTITSSLGRNCSNQFKSKFFVLRDTTHRIQST